MKTLPLSYSKKRFDYKLIQRSNKAAIYSQSFEGKLLAYEVFQVKVAKAYSFGGIQFEGGEYTPSDESFGMWAWSFGIFSTPERALERAQEKYTQLNLQENDTTSQD